MHRLSGNPERQIPYRKDNINQEIIIRRVENMVCRRIDIRMAHLVKPEYVPAEKHIPKIDAKACRYQYIGVHKSVKEH